MQLTQPPFPHRPDAVVTRRRALIAMILTGILWSTSGLFVKIISWSPMAIIGGRSLIAAIVLLIHIRRPTLRLTRWQIAGAIGYLFTQLFFVAGAKLAPAANVIFLSYTSPVYLILFGYWFLGERPKRYDWLTLPVVFVGMLLLFAGDISFEGFWGNLYGLLSGVSMSVMIICMRRQKEGRPADTILLGNVIGLLVGLPFAFQETWAVVDIGSILFLGIFQIGLSMVFYSFAIRHLEAIEATIIAYLEPILTPVWVFIVLREVPSPIAILGCVLVLAAVFWRSIAGAGLLKRSQLARGD